MATRTVAGSSNSGVSRPAMNDGEFAPIALFVYNRPDHARQTVAALRANDLANQSDLYVFADGPKNSAGTAMVEQVRKFAHTITGFKSVTVVERDRNLGLSRSVIAGVSQLCNDYGKAIVVGRRRNYSTRFLEIYESRLATVCRRTKVTFGMCL